MYLPDVNVWVALAFTAHSRYRSARTWFDRTTGPCHFCRVTQLGFLRIVNNPVAIPNLAVSQDEAWRLYDHFLAQARIDFANEPGGLDLLWRQWTQLPRFATNYWNDAYLVAFAIAGGYEVVTFDRGFTQYANLKVTILT